MKITHTLPRHPLAERSNDRFARIIALIGFVLTVFTFYPGFLSADSLDQFGQGLNFNFSDWHLPAMAFVWSLLDTIWPGPEPMLFLQAGLYWGGVYYLTSAIPTRSAAVRCVIIALFFSPVVLNFAGVIWKDVQLAAAWSFVVGYTYALRRQGRPLRSSVKVLLLVLLAYGALVRYNATLVVGPLFLYVLTGRPVVRRFWVTIAIYVAVVAGALASSQILNRLLAVEHTGVTDSLFVFDLAGISVRSNNNVYPFPLSPLEMDKVKTCYGKAEVVNPFIWGDCAFIWSKARPPGANTSLLGTWKSMVIHNISAYFHHRLAHFKNFLAIPPSPPQSYLWQNGIDANNHGYKTRYHGLYHVMHGYIQIFSKTILFRPVTWLLISVFMILLAALPIVDSHKKNLLMVLGLSGTAYLFTYLPFGVAPDFRYAYVSIIFSIFGLCVLTPRAVALCSLYLARMGIRRSVGGRLK
ncbi:MAG: hypothetical protein LBV61_05265 [Burkholderiaceae bacterium]|jgi:hypothetical protein|nr:hypothetical protein [Burkholderiaceae bacterium]